MPVSSRIARAPDEARGIETSLDACLDLRLFKALADPSRLLLLSCLLKVGRACTTSELAGCCQVDFSVANRHLKVLVAAEVLRSEKRGRTVWYEARGGDLCARLAALIAAIQEGWPDPEDGAAAGPEGGCCGPREATPSSCGSRSRLSPRKSR